MHLQFTYILHFFLFFNSLLYFIFYSFQLLSRKKYTFISPSYFKILKGTLITLGRVFPNSLPDQLIAADQAKVMGRPVFRAFYFLPTHHCSIILFGVRLRPSGI